MAPLKTIPYEAVWHWTRDSWMLLDFRDSLFPFHDDVLTVLERWRTAFGADGCRVIPTRNGRPPAKVPPPGTPVLYIGDFGMLDNRNDPDDVWDPELMQAWTVYGRWLRRRDCRPCALLPCPRERWDSTITSVWTCAYWSEAAQPPSVERGWSPREDNPEGWRTALVQLSVLAAPALRIERPLLRALRRLLLREFDAPSVEYDFFHACTRDLDAVVLSGEAATTARPGFRSLPHETQQRIVELLRQHHADCAEIVRARETLVLDACGAPVSVEEVEHAKALVRRACAALLKHLQAEDRDAIIRAGFANWQQCELESFTESTAEEIAVAWRIVQEVIGQSNVERPEAIGDQDLLWLEEIIRSGSSQKTDWQLQRFGDDVCFELPITSDVPGQEIRSGGHAVRLPARNLRLEIIRTSADGSSTQCVDLTGGYRVRNEGHEQRIEVRTDLAVLKCEAVEPPAWASRLGWDRFGLFAEFELGGVGFPLRWIPPGEFEMGSPQDEPGRFDREGPRHRVTIGHGFWLATTPVTQAQYAAVTGQWPSRFKKAGNQAPVEQVSWNDCRAFCDTLKKQAAEWEKELKNEMTFRLPSEAEWEYACRAGTTTPLYSGQPLTSESGVCPDLNELAWYDENSSGTTHPVGEKRPTTGACMTCWATFGNGVKMSGTAPTKARRMMAVRGWVEL